MLLDAATQYPDVRHAFVGGAPALEVCAEHRDFFEHGFIETVQKRGAAVIAARKLSSAASAAKAIADHLRDWVLGTGERLWVSMGVFADGSKYGIPSGVMYSVPVTCANGEWAIVEGLPVDEFSREKMDATAAELVAELKLATELIAAASEEVGAAATRALAPAPATSSSAASSPPSSAPAASSPPSAADQTLGASAWDQVPLGPPDAILGLVESFRADTAATKVNLSVGAYRDDAGAPWVLPSVRQAEEAIVAAQLNKEYAPISGDASFVEHALRFAYGDASDAIKAQRVAAVQSLSGTGALRLIGEFYARFLGKGTPVYIPSPSWGNHLNVFRDAGLDVRSYRYWDAVALSVRGIPVSHSVPPRLSFHVSSSSHHAQVPIAHNMICPRRLVCSPARL